MTPLAASPLYVSLVAGVFLWLSVRVIQARRGAGVSLGAGQDRALERRIRAQGNCAEYAPIGLLLLIVAETLGLWPVLVHVLGLMLLAGRLGHGYALSVSASSPAGRVGGMVLTLTQIAVTALAVLWLWAT